MPAHAYADARFLPRAAPLPDPTAARVLAVSGAVGAVVAVLTWHASPGLGWTVADAILVLAAIGGVARWRPGAAGWALGGASVWLAAMVAWRASDWALVTALPSSAAALVALALVCGRRLRAVDLGGVAPAALDALRLLPRGVVDAGGLPARACNGPARSTLSAMARGAVVGLPLAAVLAALLSADAAFRGAFANAVARASDTASLGAWTLVCVGAVGIAASILARLRAAPRPIAVEGAAGPYRIAPEAGEPTDRDAASTARVQPVAWAVVLAQIAAVFGVYAVANGRALFASHGAVRASGGPTYAQYVHEGFVEVSVAALLAVACVVAGHALLRPRAGGGIVAGGWRMATIECVLLGFVALALASSAHRLRLYEEAYGFTVLRLGVRFFQVGIAGLLALTAAGCVARAWRGWSSALAWSLLSLTVIVGSFNADRWVGRESIELAQRGGHLDIGYLATLSEDAAPYESASGAEFVPTLQTLWRPVHARSSDWRDWRGLGSPLQRSATLSGRNVTLARGSRW
jgi:two-component system sensor histidine kinase BaeS